MWQRVRFNLHMHRRCSYTSAPSAHFRKEIARHNAVRLKLRVKLWQFRVDFFYYNFGFNCDSSLNLRHLQTWFTKEVPFTTLDLKFGLGLKFRVKSWQFWVCSFFFIFSPQVQSFGLSCGRFGLNCDRPNSRMQIRSNNIRILSKTLRNIISSVGGFALLGWVEEQYLVLRLACRSVELPYLGVKYDRFTMEEGWLRQENEFKLWRQSRGEVRVKLWPLSEASWSFILVLLTCSNSSAKIWQNLEWQFSG